MRLPHSLKIFGDLLCLPYYISELLKAKGPCYLFVSLLFTQYFIRMTRMKNSKTLLIIFVPVPVYIFIFTNKTTEALKV